MAIKQLSRTYYFYNNLIHILNFEPSNLKLGRKTSMGLDIYYIGYADKKPEWNINIVNPLYLMINKIDDYFAQKNGKKYLKIADTVRNSDVLEKYGQVFNGIKYHIKNINGSDNVYDKDYMKIKFNSEDGIPLGKTMYFPTITVTNRCVF